MNLIYTDCFDKETNDYKMCVNATLKGVFFVGVFTMDIDCFYWHKIFVYKNGVKSRPTYMEKVYLETSILNLIKSKNDEE